MSNQFTFPLMIVALAVVVGCNRSEEYNAVKKQPAINVVATSSQKADENVDTANRSPKTDENIETANNSQNTDENVAGIALAGKLALLIGINDYVSKDVDELKGCVNDVQDMQKLLIGKFDFPEQNVKVLTNSQATHAGIVAAFRSHLIENATNDSIVVFHYSGHGSQVNDTSGDETDGLDETIVTHDSRTEGIYDITDDELNGLFTELSEKTKNVTFILDSCHSGSGTRAAGGRSRRVKMDTRTPLQATAPARNTLRGKEEGFDNDNYVLISGCRSNEESKEYDADGHPRGTLTYFLVSEIRAAVTAEEAVTYQDVMDQVKAKVSAIHSNQHPQMEGKNIHKFVFGDQTSLPQPYVLAQPKGEEEVELSGGNVLGFTAGSLFDVYAPGTKIFADPEKRIAQVELTSINAYTSQGKIVSGGPIPASSRAVERQHSYEQRKFAVYLDLAGTSSEDSVKDTEFLQKIQQEFSENSPYKDNFLLVDDQQRARLVVSERKDGNIHIAGNGSSIENPPVPRRDADAVERVLTQILHWAQWFNLLDLENSGTDLTVNFKIESVGTQRTDAAKELSRYFVSGDNIKMTVTNNSKKKLYFAIVDVCSDGSVTPQHSVSGDTEPLGPGETWSETAELFVNENQKESTDIFKLLVFDRQVDVSFLTSDATPRGAGDDACFPLANAMFKTKSRGSSPKVRRDSWMTTSQALRVIAAE